MNAAILFYHLGGLQSSRRAVTLVVVLFLNLQPALGLFSIAQASQRAAKKQTTMTADQKIAHVLSRLTFGARPGDFGRVKAMGIEAFINQQLDPDSLDDSALMAKLRKLPTLGMATPVIIEQYTPPKPVASPSPTPAQPAEKSKPLSQIASQQMPGEKNPADRMSAVPVGE